MGLVICLLGMAFGFYQFLRVKKIKAHKSMLDVSNIIFETCKTYLIQQGKFIAILFLFIGSIIAFYFGYLQGTRFSGVLLILIMDCYRYTWFLWCCLVWYSYEYFGKQQNGIFFIEKKTIRAFKYSSRCRYEYWSTFNLC